MNKLSTTSISEKEIVHLLLLRDKRGVEILYEKYGKYLYGLIFEVTRKEGASEIVMQDTFLKVWNKIDTYSFQKGRFLTWIMNIARNTAIDMTRSKHYKQSLKLIDFGVVSNYKENTPQYSNIIIDGVDLEDIVDRLDPKCKQVINYVYFKGFTHMEVAKELNLPLGTVKSRVKKGLKDLRIIFDV